MKLLIASIFLVGAFTGYSQQIQRTKKITAKHAVMEAAKVDRTYHDVIGVVHASNKMRHAYIAVDRKGKEVKLYPINFPKDLQDGQRVKFDYKPPHKVDPSQKLDGYIVEVQKIRAI